MCLLRGTDWIFIYNSTFCPHNVFMCFVWIWEQTAIISLYSTNWLLFITEMESVYCAVRTGSCNIIRVNSAFWPLVHWIESLVAGLSSQRPGVDARSVRVRFMVDKGALWQGYSEHFRFSLSISFHPFSMRFSFTFLLLEGRKGEAWGNIPIRNAATVIGQHWIERYLRFSPLIFNG
jgi:hypothetical protein